MPESGTQPALLVTQSEAARLLGISRDTLRRIVREGTLEGVRLYEGAQPRLRRGDVIGLAQARQKEDP